MKVWLRDRDVLEPGERAAHGCPPGHEPEQDQGEPERPHHLDERVTRREGGAEEQPVGEVDDPAERDAGDVREPMRPARVVDHPVGDQGARGADRPEREVQDAGRLVEHDDADAGERVHAPEREAQHDVGLEELPVDAEHGKGDDAIHADLVAP